MNDIKLSEAERISKLEPPRRKIRLVIDTDTYNEVDDQFALAYTFLSPEHFSLEALYAAPFHNARSNGPADGMQRSYEEILRLLDLLAVRTNYSVYKGATRFLHDENAAYETPASLDLIDRVMKSPKDDPLFVVGIAAITNIASAIKLEPRIIERMVVIWLGGHALDWPDTKEFNLRQDLIAARRVLDSGVPMVLIPCNGVTTHLTTTTAELEHYLRGKSRIGDYLIDIVTSYEGNPYGWSKVIWDVANIAYLINPDWVPTHLISSPILTDQVTWSVDPSRHSIRYARHVYRDLIFADLFSKLTKAAK